MELLLMRLPEDGGVTAGEIVLDGTTLYTLELGWHDNHPLLSCVPPGDYELVPYLSPMHGATWCLRNPALSVMGRDILTPAQVDQGLRSMCELHAANWSRQLLGCIALGFEHQPLLDPLTGVVEPAVENSRDAVAFLVGHLGHLSTGHTLNIVQSGP